MASDSGSAERRFDRAAGVVAVAWAGAILGLYVWFNRDFILSRLDLYATILRAVL